MKVLLKTEEDFNEYLSKSLDRAKPRNKPEEYPALLISDFYKIAHEVGDYCRFFEFLYRSDVLCMLMPQLEDKSK